MVFSNGLMEECLMVNTLTTSNMAMASTLGLVVSNMKALSSITNNMVKDSIQIRKVSKEKVFGSKVK